MIKCIFLSVILAFALASCGNGKANALVIASIASQNPAQAKPPSSQETRQAEPITSQDNFVPSSSEVINMTSMQVIVQDKIFTASLAQNTSVDAFVKMLQNEAITINMSDYAGFEKLGSLGTSLPTSNSQMTTQAGDIVLYNGSQIVVFYGSNSWSYTKIGKIDDLTGWSDALGKGDVRVTFSLS